MVEDEDLAFIKMETGIHDPDALKGHIMAVQRKAYDVRE
jgi:hypothetical protein